MFWQHWACKSVSMQRAQLLSAHARSRSLQFLKTRRSLLCAKVAQRVKPTCSARLFNCLTQMICRSCSRQERGIPCRFSLFDDVFKNVEVSEGVAHNYKNRGTKVLVAKPDGNGQVDLKWLPSSTPLPPDAKALVQKTHYSGYIERCPRLPSFIIICAGHR